MMDTVAGKLESLGHMKAVDAVEHLRQKNANWDRARGGVAVLGLVGAACVAAMTGAWFEMAVFSAAVLGAERLGFIDTRGSTDAEMAVISAIRATTSVSTRPGAPLYAIA